MIPLPAWVAAVAMHPEVQQMGMSAVKRAGRAMLQRFRRAPAPKPPEPDPVREELDDLRAAVVDLPTRTELAEVIKAVDSRNAERFASLRLWLVLGLGAQTLILGALILLT